MIFKLAEFAEKSWRRLDGHNQLPKVILGVKFSDGIEVVIDRKLKPLPPDPYRHQELAIALGPVLTNALTQRAPLQVLLQAADNSAEYFAHNSRFWRHASHAWSHLDGLKLSIRWGWARDLLRASIVNRGSPPTNSAPACCSRTVAKTVSKSASLRAFKTEICLDGYPRNGIDTTRHTCRVSE